MNRRQLFASLLGLAALPFAKLIPEPTVSMRWVPYPNTTEIIFKTINKNSALIADNVARNNDIIKLLERRMRECSESFANPDNWDRLYANT